MDSFATRRSIDLNLDLCSSEYMDTSWNLELSLSTPGPSVGPAADVPVSTEDQEQRKQMWIHYNGNICVCDAAEVRATRAIMYQAAAAREAEDIQRSSSSPQCTSPSLPPQLQRSTSIAMKRSLQRFLEKRRARIQSMNSPYHKQSSNYECRMR